MGESDATGKSAGTAPGASGACGAPSAPVPVPVPVSPGALSVCC